MIFFLTSCEDNFLLIQGNGISTTESRRADMFYRIENSTSIDIIYKTADTTGITIYADENLMQYLITEIYDNTLEIKFRSGNSHLEFKVKPLITITSPRLEKVIISGSANFSADEMSGNSVVIKESGSGSISVSKVECTDLSILLSGSGKININNCVSVSSDVYLSGSGSIAISGKSENNDLKISGSGEINAENCLLNSATIIISGSGNAYCNIKDMLTAIISGSGNIYLTGNPAITQTISGSGKIIKPK